MNCYLNRHFRALRLLRVFALASLAAASHAATYHVDSIPSLQSAIASAVGGDTIIVKNGVYPTTSAITVNRVGTADARITIAAETAGEVEFTGTHGISLASPAAYVTIEGFKFSNTSGRISMPSGTQFCRYTRNIFQCVGDGAYLTVAGHDHEVDRNEFRNKSTVGNMLDVRGAGSQVAQRLWVHHNYFHDFTSPGVNGAETIRFGLSGLSLSTGDGLVEFNLFVRCTGENELISNKSSGNTYRYNTFLDSPGAQLTLRHGNDCLAYGNIFRNTAGLRIYGDRHQVFSNYFEANSLGIDMGNGAGEVADGAALTTHDRPDDCTVSFNTFINNARHYQMGGRTDGLGATNVTFANNIIQGGGPAAVISTTAPYTGSWVGNILWNTGGAGSMPAGGYTEQDPLLAPDANGVYHLQAGSPAIDAAVGVFPAVIADQDGQPRTGLRDTGADEVSNAPILARILSPVDVGLGTSDGGGGTEPPAPRLVFEAENLAHLEVGGSYGISFEDTASGGAFASPNISDPNDPLYDVRRRYVTFGGDGDPLPPNGEYIEFVLSDIPAGTYNLLLRYKSHPNNRAVMRMFVDGQRLGPDLNQLSAATFRTHDFGVVRFAEAGDHVIRLAVVDKTNAATNALWNVTADVFTLVFDVVKPVLSLPGDMTVEATSAAGAAVFYTGSAVDNSDGEVPLIFTPSSGSIFPLGTTVVVATAEDFAGNLAVDSFEITVVDTTAPVIANLTASPSVLKKPNHKMVNVTVAVATHDAVDPNPKAKIMSVTSNEPESGPGYGNVAPDWEITGDLTLRVRNERSELGSGRIYTITVESRDAAGNVSTDTVEVLVPRAPED